MFETISSDILGGVTSGGQSQSGGDQKCKAVVAWNSCNKEQRDERNYGNQINPVTNVSALPPNEAT